MNMIPVELHNAVSVLCAANQGARVSTEELG